MPFRSPIFRKLLFSAFAPIALTLLILDFYLTRDVARRETFSIERMLESQARVMAGELAAADPARLEPWAHAAEVRAGAHTRITVIAAGGAVLADSQHDPESMENHAARPEVREAIHGRTGVSIRHSATLDRDLCYVAIPAGVAGAPAVLRLALPLQELDAVIATVRWRIYGASLAAALAALVMAYFFSRTFSRRIRRLEQFAESLLGARAADGLERDADDELGDLATSLSNAAGQLREMVDRLSLESARREAILASMVEGVLAVDNELRVTFCNESFARALGAELPVPERLPVLALVRDPTFLDLLSRVIVTHESIKQRLQLAAADGRAFEVQAAPLALRSRRGAIAILHDITDLERLERVRKDFVANVSHELRTPLTAIRGYAETLLDGALEDQENNRKFLEVIRAHAIRLNNIASDLLVLSELESGAALAPEPVPIHAALEAAVRTIESEARVRNVSLHVGDLGEGRVIGHRIRLEQAFVNLLDNAVKFNRPGGEVRIEASRTADGKLRVAIADTGIGIPSEDLPRIFERFYRVDKARSREVGGTGLGLSIVKHVIERMNGSVTVESQLGKGCIFTVLLPFAE